TGTGYYHLRLAEVLLAHGPLEEAHYHLQEASQIFRQGQQQSTGEAQLQAAWARYFTQTSQHEKAEELLKSAIGQARLHRFPRGELLFLTQLAALRLAQRRMLSAAGILLQVARIYPRAELRAGWRGVGSQVLRGGAIARRMLNPGRAATKDR